MSNNKQKNELWKAIKQAQKKDNKIVLVYANAFKDAQIHIIEALKENDVLKYPIAWVQAGLFDLLGKRPAYQNTMSITFPARIDPPLTKEECIEHIHKLIEDYSKEKNISKTNWNVIGIFGYFEHFVGRRHFGQNDLQTFLDAFMEISKKQVIIMPDPRNTFMGGVPMSRFADALSGGTINAFSRFLYPFVEKAIEVKADAIYSKGF